jgi:hypothetical protein
LAQPRGLAAGTAAAATTEDRRKPLIEVAPQLVEIGRALVAAAPATAPAAPLRVVK